MNLLDRTDANTDAERIGPTDDLISCSPEIFYRAREPNDAGDLFELFNEETFIRAATRSAFTSLSELSAWLDNIVADRKFEVVASAATQVVGFGGLYASGDRLNHAGWLMLGVRHDFRRRQIGSTLLRLLLATAYHLAGLSRVQLAVFVDNAPALRLYLGAGFEIEGVHRRFARREDGYVDAYTMAVIFDRRAERPA